MRRILPLLIFVVLIGGALAIRFRMAPDLPVVTALPVSNGTGGQPSSSQAANTQGASQKPAANPLLPPLPEVQVDAHPPHAAPAESIAHVQSDIHLPPTPHPNANFYASGKNGGEQPPFGTRSSHAGTFRETAPKQFSGPARVTAATGLMVGAQSVALFGVRSLSPTERCGAYRCVSVAVAALNSRLARNTTVFCRTPLASQGVTYAICLDAAGADLGGYLVGEGLARADSSQSYDYVGAERIAHDLRRGIWKN